MRAVIDQHYLCECGEKMRRTVTRSGDTWQATITLDCQNPLCHHHGIIYEAPSVDLKPETAPVYPDQGGFFDYVRRRATAESIGSVIAGNDSRAGDDTPSGADRPGGRVKP